MSLIVRDATSADAPQCLAVYAPFVRDTCVSFEEIVPDEAELARRIETAQRAHAWLVAEDSGQLLGQAYAGVYRAKGAWRWHTETSIYLSSAAQGRGIGVRLYGELLDRLRERGYCTAIASITLPNDASLALHRRLGFREIGIHRRAGYKLGRWVDVSMLEVPLREDAEPPPLR